ncbi:Glycosyltransferase, GT2 family [Anoxybacillus pushchinoensis]|uniref:Glycosyltransferase, GT2 family n=1 Tax=Anoxybacillus pushchinoensis TaxID=150248 RepID=A0A1I0TJ64_9BACL|nr:glycosyltransferase [Anoxybacillus pushchinoensis]SFA51832.1 Glycosyltransferase, GT2 family [Anoxybacillus pushchinoensis]
MKTSIIILTHNKLDYTKQCIESIRQYTREGTYEIIVVDNHSTDGTVEWLQLQKDIRTIFNNENVGFPKGCNQGIQVATGENILLLNNDVIVTKNWLDHLLVCLHSADDIGAVGPVTNSAAYYSTIPVNYTSVDEMHVFASQHNVLDPNKWEERLKLIGFCMLIKREAVDKVGLLDERFTPGNFEDDDYSVRLRKAGYRLMLCKDTFIHHYGSVSWQDDSNGYSKLLRDNQKKFEEKWNIDVKAYAIEWEILSEITMDRKTNMNVLHIGCGAGATLLKIKQEYPQATLYGVEQNAFAIKEAQRYAYVANDLEDGEIKKQKFDFILYSNRMFTLDDYVLRFVVDHLKPNGQFFAHVQNVGHFRVIEELIAGRHPLDRTNLYSLGQLDDLFKRHPLSMSIKGMIVSEDDNKHRLVNHLKALYGETVQSLLIPKSFVVRAYKQNENIRKLIDNFVCKKDRHQILKQLHRLSTNEVIDIIKRMDQAVELLNELAIENFVHGYHEHVLPYLQAAFELCQDDTDTLYNLAFVLNSYGEKELANRYLSFIRHPDDEVKQLFEEINEQPLKKAQELTFLLRRLEFDVDVEEAKQAIVDKLARGEIDELLIKEIIDTSIIHKVKVLQVLAITCFEQGLHEHVLPYLQLAYEQEPTNADTLYNLGYVLLYYGENELAERFLQQIQQPDEQVLDLLKVARGESL